MRREQVHMVTSRSHSKSLLSKPFYLRCEAECGFFQACWSTVQLNLLLWTIFESINQCLLYGCCLVEAEHYLGLFVYSDVSDICKAKFLDRVGKRTRCFVRFSTVGGESGSADTARDPRGMLPSLVSLFRDYSQVARVFPKTFFFLSAALQPLFFAARKPSF